MDKREWNRLWRLRNADHIRQYRKDNADYIHKRAKVYRIKHNEDERKRDQIYRKINKKEISKKRKTDKYRTRNRIRGRKERKELKDSYVKKMITRSPDLKVYLTPALIELKRAQIKVRRLCLELKT